MDNPTQEWAGCNAPPILTGFTIGFEQEVDGRWIAEVLELPGALCYGVSKEEAQAKAEALALRVVADQIEKGEKTSELTSVEFSFSS